MPHSFYRKFTKRALDLLLSTVGIILLSLPMAVIALVVKCDDPGAALFRQKRVGRGGKVFTILKFRTMPRDVPHDLPTDRFRDEASLTRVQRFLRRSSLDELPQLFNIFAGQMSVIGPRPALPSQTALLAARASSGANDLRPGLTGLAQIRGRDELDDAEKARCDGEYARRLSFSLDCRLFFGSIAAVITHRGYHEGGPI